jgi:hypothetical protein
MTERVGRCRIGNAGRCAGWIDQAEALIRRKFAAERDHESLQPPLMRRTLINRFAGRVDIAEVRDHHGRDNAGRLRRADWTEARREDQDSDRGTPRQMQTAVHESSF